MTIQQALDNLGNMVISDILFWCFLGMLSYWLLAVIVDITYKEGW